MANAPRLSGLGAAELGFRAGAAKPVAVLDGAAGDRAVRRWPAPVRLAIIIGSAVLLWAMILRAIAAIL